MQAPALAMASVIRGRVQAGQAESDETQPRGYWPRQCRPKPLGMGCFHSSGVQPCLNFA